MAYLNANIPPLYAQIRKEFLYDNKKHHGEVEDCVIFGITSMGGRAILWHALMENGAIFIGCQLRLLFNVVFNPKMFPLKDLMNWNFGILLVITLLLLLGLF
jgi:hypothetical protein